MDSPPQPGLTTLAYWRLDGFRSAVQRAAGYSGKFRRWRRKWKVEPEGVVVGKGGDGMGRLPAESRVRSAAELAFKVVQSRG